MQVTDELIRSVVQEVLSHMRNGRGNGQPLPTREATKGWGVFQDVDGAVNAAVKAQREFERRGLEDRRKAVACIRRIWSMPGDISIRLFWNRSTYEQRRLLFLPRMQVALHQLGHLQQWQH